MIDETVNPQRVINELATEASILTPSDMWQFVRCAYLDNAKALVGNLDYDIGLAMTALNPSPLGVSSNRMISTIQLSHVFKNVDIVMEWWKMQVPDLNVSDRNCFLPFPTMVLFVI